MLSLILPTYKERESLPILIPKIVESLGAAEYEIIVVDDDSPDKTWEVARGLAQRHPQLHVIRRVGRRGLSSAVIEGFLAAKGDVFVVMDADGQHDIGLILKLADAARENGGMSMGSRYMEGGSVGDWTGFRAWASRIGTALAHWVCQVRVTDPMSGFFAVSRGTFEEVLPRLNPKGFKILLDLLVHVPANTQVKELPFSFQERIGGVSKFSTQVRLQYLEFLYDATVGRYLPLTLIKYCVVGVMGVAVNLAAYAIVSLLLNESPQFGLFSTPLLAGIEAAIVFNFFFNNAWTFSYAKLRGWKAVTGFAKYNVVCAFGAFANIAVTAFLYRGGMGTVSSLAIGAFIGMMWNYTIGRLFTWNV
ncbi:MAG: glycosyltransferase family 2 protein [Candidatus Peribacteraceae bacterium]|nr:glycosyltransferase family 2 protein [Candidatus Peribacteraceae bacterium]